MKVVCVWLVFEALVAMVYGQAYVSYYGQDLNHPTLSKESNTEEEAQLYKQQDNSSENHQDLLSKLLLKHYGFDGEEQTPQNLHKEELQHHIEKRHIDYDYYTNQKIHIPIITKEGVPLDTPEVRKARKQHLLAHAIAKARQYYPHSESDEDDGSYKPDILDHPFIGRSGVPVETPEVQLAKKQHFAAIRAAKALQYHQYLTQPRRYSGRSFIGHASQYEEEFPYEQHVDGYVGQQEYVYGYYG